MKKLRANEPEREWRRSENMFIKFVTKQFYEHECFGDVARFMPRLQMLRTLDKSLVAPLTKVLIATGETSQNANFSLEWIIQEELTLQQAVLVYSSTLHGGYLAERFRQRLHAVNSPPKLATKKQFA